MKFKYRSLVYVKHKLILDGVLIMNETNRKKQTFLFNKSILSNISNDGCIKRGIKSQILTLEKRNKNIDKNNKKRDENDIKENLYDTEFIMKPLNIKQIPAVNVVPLVAYQESAKSAELATIVKLINKEKINIYTECNTDKVIFNESNKKIIESKYVESIEMLFSDKIQSESIETEENIGIEEKYEIDDVEKEKFCSIAEPHKYRYLYQLKYKIKNPSEIIEAFAPSKMNFYQSKNIEFEAFIPDFIKIVDKNELDSDGTNYKVLKENFKIRESSNDKIKLMICDVKMSEYRESFSSEVSIYIITLHQFLLDEGLSEDYEVIAKGEILNEYLRTLVELECGKLENKPIYFENSKNSIEALFNTKLVKFIEIIENGDIETYKNVNMSPACATCDFYGGYLAGRLEREGKSVNLNGMTSEERLCEIDSPVNDFCTEVEKRNKTINIIPSLKNSEKKILIENGINKYNEINDECISELKDKNLSLYSNKNKVVSEVEIKMDINDGKRVKNKPFSEKTANASKFVCGASKATINFYIDAKSDSQNIGLCMGYAFEYIDNWGNKQKRYYDKDTKQFIINNNKGFVGYPSLNYIDKEDPRNKIDGESNVNVIVIDDINEEKYYFITFLIGINEAITSFEKKYKEKDLRIAFYYWNNKAIEYFRRLFMETMSILIPKYGIDGKEIDEDNVRKICNMHTNSKLISDIKKVYYRLRGLLTVEEKDQIYLADRTLFNLKSAVEDVYVLNSEFNNTLLEVHRNSKYVDPQLVANNFKNISFFKRYTDEIHGGVIPKLHSSKQKPAKRQEYENKISEMLKCRLYSMSEIRHSILEGNIAIEPRTVPSVIKENSFNNSYVANLIFLFSKLQIFADRESIENIHAEEFHKKTVRGDSLKLLKELRGEERIRILAEKSEINNYRVYVIDENSIYADYKEGDRQLLLYPQNKYEYIYKSISCNENFTTGYIYIDDNEIKSEINRIAFGGKKWLETLIEDDPALKSIIYKYRNIMNGRVKIEELNRQEKYIVLYIDDLGCKIINYLEENPQDDKADFNYSNDVILEKEQIDYWLPNLKQCLSEYVLNENAQNLLENYIPKDINNEIGEKERKIQENLGIDLEKCKLEAIAFTMLQPLSILWGPPGTGKTFTIALLILNYLIENKNRDNRILLVGNYTPTFNIFRELIKLKGNNKFNNLLNSVEFKRIVTDLGKEKEEGGDGIQYIKSGDMNSTFKLLHNNLGSSIISSTSQQIYKHFIKGTCQKPRSKKKIESDEVWVKQCEYIQDIYDNGFDLIIVDEASQMEIGRFIPAILRYGESSKILLAGDPKQLQPVLKVRINDLDEHIFGSVLDYYLGKYGESDKIVRTLKTNRRSNKVIVEATKYIGGYKEYVADKSNELRKIILRNQVDYKTELASYILNPELPIIMIRYNDYGRSGKVNIFEADQIVEMVGVLWDDLDLGDDEYNYEKRIKKFLKETLGIVVVHNAQKIWLQNKLISYLDSKITEINVDIDKKCIEELVIAAVDTVDRYQGGEREVIIGCFGVSEKELIEREAEFLFNPNRINVMLSRARSKFILIVPNELIQFNPSEYDILEYQRALLKLNELCANQHTLNDEPWNIDGREGIVKYLGFNDI